MANEHPFQMLFETLGRLPIAHADSVNRQAYEILYDILSVPVEKTGRCILLRAPRAGHGKTHLLSRIQHHLGASHEFIPLHAAFGSQVNAVTVIDDTLRRLLRPLPASGGLCVLDLVTRRLFSAALQPLVGSGEVPCQDREGALTALRTRPIETFDFHHPNAVTAHWARENFEVLGQRLSVELAQRCALPAREVAFWVDAMFRFAATPLENPVRLRVLVDSVHAGDPSGGVLMERLEALLAMLSLLMRVVLVADDLEGFSADESAALRLAAFLGEIRQSVERLDVILSINQDIWENAFVPRLSGGLTDRLSEVVVELNPLTEDEMVALLESRVPGLGARVMSRVDRGMAGTHARGLIRAAGVAWLRASALDGAPSVSAPRSAEPVPAAAPMLPEAAVKTFDIPAITEVAENPLPVVAAVNASSMEIAPIRPQDSEPMPSEAPAGASAFTPVSPAPTELSSAPMFTPVASAEAKPFAPTDIPPVTPEVPEPTAPVFAAAVPAEPAPLVAPETSERAPDPTLAIAFLAAARASEEAHSPVDAPSVEGDFKVEGMSPPPAAEIVPPVSSMEKPTLFGDGTPASGTRFEVKSDLEALETGKSAVSEGNIESPSAVFQPAPQSPADMPGGPSEPSQVLSENSERPAFEARESVAVPEEKPVFQAEEASQPQVPDTDRVDDLLRQFRERYGRGGA